MINKTSIQKPMSGLIQISQSELSKTLEVYDTFKSELSVRSKNILEDLEERHNFISDESSKIIFFEYLLNKNINLLKQRNAGIKTVQELELFIIKILKFSKLEYSELVNLTHKPQSDLNEQNNSNRIKKFQSELNGIDTLLLGKLYYSLKLNSSIRAIHFLDNLENEFNFSQSDEDKITYFKFFISEENKIKKSNNIGDSTLAEINLLKLNLTNYLLQDNINIKNVIAKSIINKLNSKLNNENFLSELEEIVEGIHFDFQKICCVFIKNYNFNETKSRICTYYLFEDNLCSSVEISRKLSVSRQLVSLFIKELNESIVPSFIKNLLNLFNYRSNEGYFLMIKNILIVENNQSFEFCTQIYTPNDILININYKNILADKFLSINDFFDINILVNKSFYFKSQIIFISINFIEQAHLIELMNFINIEIYNFEKIYFEYNLSILIDRFYKENNISISDTVKIDLLILINKIKKTVWEFDSNTITKLEKKNISEKIFNYVYSMLINSKAPQKSSTLLSELIDKDFEIDKKFLLSVLNKHKSVFIRFGNGYWGLKEWNTTQGIHGSLSDMIKFILLRNDNPIHLYELLNMIREFRPITSSSLITCLKVSKNCKFKFFNCSFIGLDTKIYNSSWYSLPSFNPGHMKKFKGLSEEDFIEKICDKYSYPKIHLQYLFKLKNERIKKVDS